MNTQPEVWLRGPVAGVEPALMPVAHALLQTLEDVEAAAADLTLDQLWTRPGGAASAGFHLLHLDGSTDRLFTYARGETLTTDQRAALAAEREPPRVTAAALIESLRQRVETSLGQLRATPPASLQQSRPVGRAGLPTTVLGLLFHAAEHAQRHAGQLVTTVKFIRSGEAGEA
jgi:DinB superfamily